jgi:predicted PurR-regulated permease PerM
MIAIVVTVALALFVWRTLDILLLLFGAILFAIALRSLSDLIERWTPLPEGWALGLAIVSLLAVITLAVWLFGAEARAQVDVLREALPRAWESLQKRFGDAAWFSTIEETVDAPGRVSRNVLASARWAALSALAVLTDFLLIAFGAVFIAAQPALYRRGLLALFPPPLRARAGEAVDACGGALRLWLLGQLASMAIVGVMTGVGLWLVGLPSAFVLGVLAGLAEFVPIVGPILSAIPGLLLALSQGTHMVLWVLAVYVVVQQVESYVIMPFVHRTMVSLPPALTLFAVVAMAAVFGPLGVLFATPLTVVAYVLVKQLYIVDVLDEPTHIPGQDRD